MRWYHAEVVCSSRAIVYEPRLSVKAWGSADYGAWYFSEHPATYPQPRAIHRSGLRIPLVGGNLTADTGGYLKGSPIPPASWCKTYNCAPDIASFRAFKANTSERFSVRVEWTRRDGTPGETIAEFELRFGESAEDVTFVHVPATTDKGRFSRVFSRLTQGVR